MHADKDYWKKISFKISFKPYRIHTPYTFTILPYTFYLCCQGSILIHAAEVNCDDGHWNVLKYPWMSNNWGCKNIRPHTLEL